jgi:glycosyltransferase involved in cell wall biosynthesis
MRPVFIEYGVAVIPAYNEERSIGSVVLKAREYVGHVIVVDDGSTDATAVIARMAGATVVRHEFNSGKGVALNTGFRKAQALFIPQVVITIDGDWQHMTEELPQVAAPVLAGDADMVIGSRYLEKKSHVPLQRILGHWGFNALLNFSSGTPLTDSQSGFRAFSLEAVRCISLSASGFGSKGFSVESEMQFLACDYGLRVVEVPITIRYLDKPKRPLASHGLKVLNGILKLIGQTRPLLFFTAPGLVITVIGLIVGVWVINVYYASHELAVGMALVAVLLLFLGPLTLFTGIILHSLRGLILELARGTLNGK